MDKVTVSRAVASLLDRLIHDLTERARELTGA
jgi:hypothetical protein